MRRIIKGKTDVGRLACILWAQKIQFTRRRGQERNIQLRIDRVGLARVRRPNQLQVNFHVQDRRRVGFAADDFIAHFGRMRGPLDPVGNSRPRCSKRQRPVRRWWQDGSIHINIIPVHTYFIARQGIGIFIHLDQHAFTCLDNINGRCIHPGW
ncbi:hypothetical protein D3C85_1301290 [compost metagenome]